MRIRHWIEKSCEWKVRTSLRWIGVVSEGNSTNKGEFLTWVIGMRLMLPIKVEIMRAGEDSEVKSIRRGDLGLGQVEFSDCLPVPSWLCKRGHIRRKPGSHPGGGR